MRRAALFLIALGILAAVAVWYPPWVAAPAKDGPGPLSISVDPRLPAPEYHTPLDWWTTHHADVLNRGDLTQADCLQCHVPEQSCNQCHRYVGTVDIVP